MNTGRTFARAPRWRHRAKRAVALLLLHVPMATPAQAQAQASVAATAQASALTLPERVAAALAGGAGGARYGLVVAAADGHELIAISPTGRFVPASNTKIVTTAAAMAILVPPHAPGAPDPPDTAGGTAVGLRARRGGPPDVILAGHGDARLSSAADCVSDCLAALADTVARRTRRVHDVVGDDTAFADERWSAGMSWNNMADGFGTAVSALSLDDNAVPLTVSATRPGRRPRADATGYFTVGNRATTVAGGTAALAFDRLPGSRVLRLSGTIPAGAAPERFELGIDDPAHYAAWRLRALLRARGVRISGAVRVRHRPPGEARAPGPPDAAVRELARLTPAPLAADLVLINKQSQNLHAELLLRRLAPPGTAATVASGLDAVAALLARVPVAGFSLSDGSGLSSYNRVTPRGMVALLRWIAGQPWGADWRATLPVAGTDGTLARRFRGTALAGRLSAKTGTLDGTAALAGYAVAASGQALTFAAYANDDPDGTARARIDAALLLLAAAL